MRKKTILQEVVYPPYGLPEALIDWAIREVKNKHHMCFVTFERVGVMHHPAYDNHITLRLEAFGEGLLDESRLKTAAESLRKELRTVSKTYLFFKEVYGLEPKKSWRDRLRR